MKNLPISNTERLVIISELATMLTAGIPIIESIDSLLQDSKGNSKKVLEKLKDDLNQGKPISESLREMPQAFEPVVISLINAAEESGNLEVTLKDIAKGVKKDMELSEKIKAALVYPSLILAVFGGVLLLILTFVIPRVASVFSKLKVTLPLPTKILIAISDFLLTYTIPTIAVFFLVVILIVVLYKFKKAEFINFLSSLPGFSNLAKEIDFTRFSHTMFLLLSAGIPITKALELVQNVVSKKKTAKAIEACKEAVLAGHQLSEGFKSRKDIFPSIVARITEVGEKSGSLAESMQNLSEYFEGKVSNTLKNLTVLLEPILILIVGILVGGMMLAIIAPIYQLIGQIRGR